MTGCIRVDTMSKKDIFNCPDCSKDGLKVSCPFRVRVREKVKNQLGAQMEDLRRQISQMQSSSW